MKFVSSVALALLVLSYIAFAVAMSFHVPIGY